MAGCHLQVRITKRFGGASIQQGVYSWKEAKGQLDYFWIKREAASIIVSVDGEQVRSFRTASPRL